LGVGPGRRILITGAAGGIGEALREGLTGRYGCLRLADIRPLGEARPGEEVIAMDLRDLASVERGTRDVDAIVHLGGNSLEAGWDDIWANNIAGTFNLYEAARRCGVKRVVFASSNHVVGFHRREHTVGPDSPLRPDTRYGVSKVFGEGIARLYADKHGLASICLRIGQFRPKPTNRRMLSLWISPRDMVQLVQRSLDVEAVHFEIVYGVSANRRCWYDNPGATRIGFQPMDNAEDYAAEIEAQTLEEPALERAFQGGPFCSDEFDGDAGRIE
jgi:uronate dehydrogenase